MDHGVSLNAKEGAWAGDLEDPQRKVTVAKEVAERDVSKRECMPTWGELLCMLFLQRQCVCACVRACVRRYVALTGLDLTEIHHSS